MREVILIVNYVAMIFKNTHFPFRSVLTLCLFISSLSSPVFAQKPKPVYEIAVRMVKKGKKEDFAHQRTGFIKLLKKQTGIGPIREFQSFYALPNPDKRPVFIGITKYANLETVSNVSKKIMPRLMQFTQTMDLKAYVFAMLIEDKKFNLKKLAAKKGQVLEIAIRRIKKGQNKAFQETRKAYLNYLRKQKGVLGSWEFAVVGGRNRERLTVDLSVYKNKKIWTQIAKRTQASPLATQYLSTFDPVMVQYATRVQE